MKIKAKLEAKYLLIIIVNAHLWLSPAFSHGQGGGQDSQELVIAVLKFTNNTDVFAYDELAASIPEILKTELSRYPRLIVVERQRIEKILSEQALSLTGFIDEASAQQVGQLLGAKFILTGEISRINSRLRIDCHIISVESGQVKGEKIVGPGGDALEKMLQLLASNIFHNLTGEGNFQSTAQLRNYPTRWFLVGTAMTAITSGITHFASRNAYDSYQDATRLDDIDRYYDRANNFRKARNGFVAAAGVLTLTTVIMWLIERGQRNRIYAGAYPDKPPEPFFAIHLDQNVSINWTIHF